MAGQEETLVSYDAKNVMTFCKDILSTEKLIAWMDSLIAENVSLQVMLVESTEENRDVRLRHYASQISVYTRIRDAAKRALDIANGQPPERLDRESTEVAVL